MGEVGGWERLLVMPEINACVEIGTMSNNIADLVTHPCCDSFSFARFLLARPGSPHLNKKADRTEDCAQIIQHVENLLLPGISCMKINALGQVDAFAYRIRTASAICFPNFIQFKCVLLHLITPPTPPYT